MIATKIEGGGSLQLHLFSRLLRYKDGLEGIEEPEIANEDHRRLSLHHCLTELIYSHPNFKILPDIMLTFVIYIFLNYLNSYLFILVLLNLIKC